MGSGAKYVEKRDLIHHGVRREGRSHKGDILGENIEKIRRFCQEPRFPEARKIWNARLMTSHTHTDPSIPSLFLNANHQTYEIARSAGIGLGEVVCAVYDMAIPKDDFGVGHRLQFGASGNLRPAFLKGDIAYNLQPTNAPTINLSVLETELKRVFDGDAAGRVSEVLSVIEGYQNTVQRGWREASSRIAGHIGSSDAASAMRFINFPGHGHGTAEHELVISAKSIVPSAIASMRTGLQLLLAGSPDSISIANGGWEIAHEGRAVGFVKEVNFSSMIGKVADTLEVLGTLYGKHFYEMPLGGSEFEVSGYVKAIAPDGRRTKVEFDGSCFSFSYSYADLKGEKRTVSRSIPAADIYDAMRKGEVIPTVPAIILATCTGPQIQHLGNIAWKKYSLREIKRQVEWLGIADESASAKVAGELTLTTHGHEVFGVRYGDGEDETLHGLPLGYITFGREEILKNLADGTYIETTIKSLARR
ncbi:MAG: hypothetical protein M1569_03450 [Candidatus Marsarchaeota archaeon]|nr:hypothetical protein [Candidatus Marsarchaeota archaeon]MCL5413432.1 hypothetical protein [Candidatus Marsarchaeota archaeon]